MKLRELLDLRKESIVSIVGAGGKTSLMFNLAEELKEESKVLVTTTTKIFMPNKDQYDYMCLNKKDYLDYSQIKNKGIYIFGSSLNEAGKIVGLDSSILETVSESFNYTLIEADGSKMKPIKGWGINEPVIYKKTNKTIGVLDIKTIGKTINGTNVHRLEDFLKLTNSTINEAINIRHLISLILHPDGLFKNALGEKILFINKIENADELLMANKLLEALLEKSNICFNKVIIGSLMSKKYQLAF